ncbi:hypothetical protein J6S37_03355 [Candidatus Saccharibacteria bacterium]|nr:hypothetical protein [Candidatus Saccharibacteria bacterium]
MKPKINLTKIIIIFTVIVLIIIGISAYFIIDNAQKTATISIFVAPKSADITLNDENYPNMSEIRVRPGDYSLSITKEGYFESYYEEFTILDNQTRSFFIALAPIDGTNWYENHPDDSYTLDTIEDAKLVETNKNNIANYPLLASLPITVEYYKTDSTYVYYVISYELYTGGTPTILVKDYSGNNYEDALDRVRLLGYNPDDYVIEYQDLTEKLKPGRAPND